MKQLLVILAAVLTQTVLYRFSTRMVDNQKAREAPDHVQVVLVEIVRPVINQVIMKNFKEKNVLISGGSSGIGLALAQDLAKLGANITLLARDKKRLSDALLSIKPLTIADGQLISAISCDVTDYNDLSNKLNSLSFDILINSAGIAYPGEFLDLDQEIFARVINTNYLGTVNLTKIVVPDMVTRRSGQVVNISSLAAVIGIYGYTAYAPSKYALHGFSRALRSELKPYGIDVSIVFPPDTDTPQLAYEKKLLPEITRMINENGGVLTAHQVSRSIINGMKRSRFTIIPGIEGKILYVLAPIFDWYFYHFAVRNKQKNIS